MALEHVRQPGELDKDSLMVAPYCRNLLAYCSSQRKPYELCQVRSGAAQGSLKWVTTLLPIVTLNRLDAQWNQYLNEL